MLNKSQLLIVGVISSAMLGIPDITEVFTKEIINIVSVNPSLVMIILISLLKIALIIASITWVFQLVKNIEFTYNNHPTEVFNKYLLKLVITAVVTIFVMILVLR